MSFRVSSYSINSTVQHQRQRQTRGKGSSGKERPRRVGLGPVNTSLCSTNWAQQPRNGLHLFSAALGPDPFSKATALRYFPRRVVSLNGSDFSTKLLKF